MDDLWVDEIPEETPYLFVCDGQHEWSALYVDGKLNKVGDHYLIDEQIRVLAGVVTMQTEDFMRGGTQRQDVAENINELRAYRKTRLELEKQAADMRLEAQDLLRKADLLEGKA